MLFAIYLILVVVILRQFASRLSPSRSLGWWATFVLLGIAVVDANLFGPLASLLGFQLISNFLFAAMIFLALFEVLSVTSLAVRTVRQQRFLVARLASNDFCQGPGGAARDAKVLIVVPCYNEKASLPATIARLRDLMALMGGEALVCFVDDGSVDGTWEVLQAGKTERLVPVRHAVNIGVSGVLLTAFMVQRELGFDFVIQCDADGQHPVEDIPGLLAKARQEKTDLLLGSRFGRTAGGEAKQKDRSSTVVRRGGGLVIKGLLGMFGPKAMVDDPTSGFRVFSRRLGALLLLQMPDEYPEPETIAIAARQGWHIAETPVVMFERVAGRSSISRLGALRYMYKVMTALVALRLVPARRLD